MAAPAKKPASRTVKRPQIAPQARALEWGFGVVAGLLVIALLGYLAFEGLRTQRPPGFTLTVQQVARLGGRYHVAVEVANTGDATAAEVVVRGVLDGDASETVLDFLPPRSRRQSILIFARDPAGGGALALLVRGYNQP